MQIIMNGETDITLENFDEPDFDVRIATDEHVHFSALPMFVSSFGLCTASVLNEYARQIDASTESLRVRVQWEYAEDPFRVRGLEMNIEWPDLPDSRLKAAERAADQCTIHNTLRNPPEIETTVTNGS